PTKRDGTLFAIAGSENTWKGTLDTGGTDFVGRYDGVVTSTFLVRAMAGRHKEKQLYGGPGKTLNQLLDQTVSPNLRSGGFAFFQDEKLSRNAYILGLTKFAGNH